MGEAHAGLGVGLEGAVVVGDDEGVGTQAGIGRIALVFDPAEQAFFDEQALHESEVALLVLDAHRERSG